MGKRNQLLFCGSRSTYPSTNNNASFLYMRKVTNHANSKLLENSKEKRKLTLGKTGVRKETGGRKTCYGYVSSLRIVVRGSHAQL